MERYTLARIGGGGADLDGSPRLAARRNEHRDRVRSRLQFLEAKTSIVVAESGVVNGLATRNSDTEARSGGVMRPAISYAGCAIASAGVRSHTCHIRAMMRFDCTIA